MNDTITLAMTNYSFLIEHGTTVGAKEFARRIREYSSHPRTQTIADELEQAELDFTRFEGAFCAGHDNHARCVYDKE